MKRKGKIFIISGPSGAGKTTIARKILREIKDLRRSISCTTRNRRRGERNNIDYRFITKQRFDELIKQNAFLEWARVLSNFYGTLEKDVTATLQKGNDILLCIDVQGAEEVSKKMPEAISIFIRPPNLKELKRRLIERGESLKEVDKRLALAKQELQKASSYDYIVTNDSLQKALEMIKYIIYAQRGKKRKGEGETRCRI